MIARVVGFTVQPSTGGASASDGWQSLARNRHQPAAQGPEAQPATTSNAARAVATGTQERARFARCAGDRLITTVGNDHPGSRSDRQGTSTPIPIPAPPATPPRTGHHGHLRRPRRPATATHPRLPSSPGDYFESSLRPRQVWKRSRRGRRYRLGPVVQGSSRSVQGRRSLRRVCRILREGESRRREFPVRIRQQPRRGARKPRPAATR